MATTVKQLTPLDIPLPAVEPVEPFDSLIGDKLALKIDRVAELLDTSKRTIYRLLESGELEAIKIGSLKHGGKRVSAASLRAFLDRGGAGQQNTATVGERMAAVRARNKVKTKATLWD